jgi:hypothetical protein
LTLRLAPYRHQQKFETFSDPFSRILGDSYQFSGVLKRPKLTPQGTGEVPQILLPHISYYNNLFWEKSNPAERKKERKKEGREEKKRC